MIEILEALWELKEVMEEWNDIPLAADWGGSLEDVDDRMNEWFKKAQGALGELEEVIRKDR